MGSEGENCPGKGKGKGTFLGGVDKGVGNRNGPQAKPRDEQQDPCPGFYTRGWSIPHPLRFPWRAGDFGCAKGNISPEKCISERPGVGGGFDSTGPDYPGNTEMLKYRHPKIQVS